MQIIILLMLSLRHIIDTFGARARYRQKNYSCTGDWNERPDSKTAHVILCVCVCVMVAGTENLLNIKSYSSIALSYDFSRSGGLGLDVLECIADLFEFLMNGNHILSKMLSVVNVLFMSIYILLASVLLSLQLLLLLLLMLLFFFTIKIIFTF